MSDEFEINTTAFSLESWDRWQVQLMREIVRYKKTHGKTPNNIIGNDAMGQKLQEISKAWEESGEAGDDHAADHHEMTELIMELGGAPNTGMGFVVDEDMKDNTFLMALLPMEEFEGEWIEGGEYCDASFVLEDWSDWDVQIEKQAEAFAKEHEVYPNLMAASEATFERLNKEAKESQRRERAEDAEPLEKEEEEGELESFASGNFELTFCLSPEAAEGEFLLIFDPDPEFLESEEDESVDDA